MAKQEKLITVQTKWEGNWGQEINVGPNRYRCSPTGEMDVSEEDARILCESVGWRRKPVERQPVASAPPAPPSGGKKPKGQPPAPPPPALPLPPVSSPEPPKPDAPAAEGKSSSGDDGGAGFVAG